MQDPTLHRSPPPTLPAEHLPDNFSETKIFEPRPIEQPPVSQATYNVATAPSETIFASSSNPISLEPATIPQQAAPIPPPLDIPKRASIAHKLISHPFRFSLAFLTLLIALGGGFMLLRADQQVDSSLGSQSSTTDENLISSKDSQINLNFDTTIQGKLGIGVAPTGDADLQVAGDIQTSGGLFVSGGSSSLSDSGLIINTITVCTTAGCAPTSTTTSAAGAGSAGATGLQGPAGAIGATGPKGDTGDAMCTAGCVLVQTTTPGVAQTGNVNVTGNIIANGFSGDGTNVNNVNALTLQGNSASYYTNASNITAGTLSDARLSVNVSLLAQTIESAEITNSTIVNDDINSSAGVAYSKLNLADSIVNTDINAAAAIAYSKLSLAGSVINADLAGSITDTKLNTITTAGKVADSALTANVTLQGNTFNGVSQLVQLTAGGILPVLSGANLTSLNATNLASGTLADARLSTNVSLLGSTIESAEITNDSIVNTDINSSAAIDWTKISKTGSSLADLTTRSAGDLSSGTLADARLTATVTLQGNTFNGVSQLVQLDAGGLLPALNGSALTNLNASNLASGTVADARLSANVSLLGSAIDSTEITNDSIVNADISAAAAIDWTKLNKTGSSLVDLTTRSAGDLSSGTLADARLSTNVTLQGNTFNGASQLVQLTAGGILPVLSGANLTSLNASSLASGTVADARLSSNVTVQGNTFNGASQLVQLTAGGILPVLSGANLTSLNASNLSSGTVDNARLAASVTIQGNTFNGASQLVQLDAGGLLPALNGSALTNLNASNLASGTVADARLSANVSLLGQTIDSAEIVNDSIVNADINSLAAIAYSKLNLGTSVVNADIAVGAAIAYSKLNLAGAVTNADLAGSIADSKLLTISTAGKVADSALSANIAKLDGTGPQSFTGNNKFTGTALFQNAADSSTAFQVQNTAGNSILLVDTSAGQAALGKASTLTGKLVLYNAAAAGSVTLQAANPGASSFTLTLPAETGTICTTGSVCTGYAAASAGVPSGAVNFFNLSSCPSGWTELTGARGRYLIGLPASGTLAGTAGTALTNLENRATGQHNHGVTDPGHSHSVGYGPAGGNVWWPGASDYHQGNTTSSNTTGITIDNAGSVAGTNAPYIQLLVCQKD